MALFVLVLFLWSLFIINVHITFASHRMKWLCFKLQALKQSDHAYLLHIRLNCPLPLVENMRAYSECHGFPCYCVSKQRNYHLSGKSNHLIDNETDTKTILETYRNHIVRQFTFILTNQSLQNKDIAQTMIKRNNITINLFLNKMTQKI